MNSTEPQQKSHNPGYQHLDRHLISVDCIIFGFSEGRLNLLTVSRDVDPYRGKPALMGGFLLAGESVEEAAARVLYRLTGLKDVYLEQFRAFGEIDREVAERTVSIAYYALVEQDLVSRSLSNQYQARWVPAIGRRDLVLDHDHMVERALKRLRYRVIHEPVAFGLLPEKFTLTQLQSVYEAIFDTPIDAGNFRRRLRRMDYLIRLGEKDLSTSRKGAWYYTFDEVRYEATISDGHEFLLKP